MELREYRGKKIIGWWTYNINRELSDNRRLYVYPRFIKKNDEYEEISENDFGQYGSIEVALPQDDTVEDFLKRVSDCRLLDITINIDLEEAEQNQRNSYFLKYNKSYRRNSSEIWLEPFSGIDFYQIVDMDFPFSIVRERREIRKETNDTIYASQILLRYNDETYYGPFEGNISANSIELRGMKNFDYVVGKYTSQLIESNLLIVNDGLLPQGIFVILLPQNKLPDPRSCKDNYDWMSNSELLDSLSRYLRNNKDARTATGWTKAQSNDIATKLKYLSDLVQVNNDYAITEDRLQRVLSIINDYSESTEFWNGLTNRIMDNPEKSGIIIDQIIKSFPERISEVIDKDLSIINQNEKESNNIETSPIQEAQNVDYSIQLEEKEKTILDLQEKIRNLNEQIRQEQTLSDLENKIKKLDTEAAEAQKRYESLNDKNKQLSEGLQKTIDQFSDQALAAVKVLDTALIQKVMEKASEKDGESSPVLKANFPLLTINYGDAVNEQRIIDDLVNFIQENRNISKNEVINYLICLTQGFITTFAGEPGTGKTSICNILARALGLQTGDAVTNRFTEVSVERGWRSHKDFIGYYNPLTNTMEKSNYEVFNAFAVLNNECDNDIYPPYILLLDEANLSPIEHYWAVFLRKCDIATDNSIRMSLSLGGDQIFNVPQHLRFLATVNFDHTTEELSPRFLDRSWVVTLDPQDRLDENNENNDNAPQMIAYQVFQQIFLKRDDDQYNESIKNKWNSIMQLFKSDKCSLPIMPRSQRMVENYCHVANRCMDMSNRLTPLDYAFSQKILPTINGMGENFEYLINGLINLCDDMPMSKKHLLRIKRNAERNLGFYQFFSR